jgi:tRNA G26 N,N-dimethylase Trm1
MINAAAAMVRGYENADSREVLYTWNRMCKLWPIVENVVPLYVYHCSKCGREIEATGYPAPVVTCCGEVAKLANPAYISHRRMILYNNEKTR